MHFNSPAIEKLPLPPKSNKKLINYTIKKSEELYDTYGELMALKNEMFDCINNHSINEFKINKKYLHYKRFVKELDKLNVNTESMDNFEEFSIKWSNINEKISSLNSELNNLFYQLYELNDEEIQIIEENF